MKNKGILVSIIVLSIIAILIGVFYPDKKTTKIKKNDDYKECVLTKKNNYYLLEYKSSYDKYSVVDDIYGVFDNKTSVDKIIDKVGCDSSKLNVNYSDKNIVIMEVLTNPKIEEIKEVNEMLQVRVQYKLDDKAKYNLIILPVSKNINDFDIRISPIYEETKDLEGMVE